MSAEPRVVDSRGASRAVHVHAVFHVAEDEQAQAVAAKMVDRAHEIANLPECECDVDVSVERARPEAATHLVELGDGLPPCGQPASL